MNRHVGAPPRPSPALRLDPPPRTAGRSPDTAVGVNGKHLVVAGRPFSARGVTYGGFAQRADGAPFPTPGQVAADFASIAAAGFNVVRTYAAPPRDVLDLAEEHGLRLLVGVHYDDWRMHRSAGRAVTRRVLDDGRRAIDEAMTSCAGRGAVLAICVGNEVPADLVRLNGVARVERTLATLIDAVHEADPTMLATYANFPSTEYLAIEGQDLACYNVFLESTEPFAAYLRHLQIAAGDVPVMISELGLAAGVHGERAQADVLASQLRALDESGCAGGAVFSWTDDWVVAGHPVDGWGFGLTDAQRRAKPALERVASWARTTIQDLRPSWPTVSVVVCAYNEEANIEACLDSLAACPYPDLEVIVCDDGSTDRTLELARRYPFRVLALAHAGLSVARNEGLRAANGEIVAYLDADARCHPHWPYHLALSLEAPGVGATGGPNLEAPEAGLLERAISRSPGNPIHVLLGDDRAEHVPGCNMAFRRDALADIGGFDPIFTTAGDDVDVCWRILDAGHEIRFSAAAQVTHRRRATVRGYLKQQRGYGRAERMVSGRHRHRYRGLGRARWAGSIYGGARALPWLLRNVVYHGLFGQAPFQPVRHRRSHAAIARAATWAPPATALMLTAPLGVLWAPLALPAATAALFLLCYAGVVAATVRMRPNERAPRRLRALVGLFHVVQPLARTWGRVRGRPVPSSPGRAPAWSGDRARWLEELDKHLSASRCIVSPGTESDAWDLSVRVGPFLRQRITTAVAWRWVPLWHASLRPRWTTALAASAAGALASMRPVAGAIVAGAGLAGAAVEAAVLRARVRAAIRRTTQGS